jgi:hypothetical protein
MAVGNVGDKLAPYAESDTFLSRDAGFTWEEVHKDAHLWEFGDSGSILVMANDEEPTDYVLFTTDEGLNWREYKFTDEKIRVLSIVTIPADISRRFILFGSYGRSRSSVAVHVDFSSHEFIMCVSSPFSCHPVALLTAVAYTQVNWILRTRDRTTLSCGARARNGLNVAYSVAR